MSNRGPPERVRKKFQNAKRGSDGSISVKGDAISEFAEKVDWDNLTPAEEYILAILDENNMLE